MKNKTLRGPLKCWDIYTMYLSNQVNHHVKQMDIKVLMHYKKKFNWSFNIEALILNNEFKTIVLTNYNQEILWVNKGFTKMTGYSMKYAIGKRPKFLQGKETSEISINNIRKKLKKEISFKETIINYRKNGALYNCEIDMYPLKNTNNNQVHFLALENEIKV